MSLLVKKSVAERVRRLELPWSRHGVDPYGATQDELTDRLQIQCQTFPCALLPACPPTSSSGLTCPAIGP